MSQGFLPARGFCSMGSSGASVASLVGTRMCGRQAAKPPSTSTNIHGKIADKATRHTVRAGLFLLNTFTGPGNVFSSKSMAPLFWLEPRYSLLFCKRRRMAARRLFCNGLPQCPSSHHVLVYCGTYHRYCTRFRAGVPYTIPSVLGYHVPIPNSEPGYVISPQGMY